MVGMKCRFSVLFVVAATAAVLLGAVPVAGAATSVHHPTSHTSVQWWVPFLIVLAVLVIVFVVLRRVQVHRRH